MEQICVIQGDCLQDVLHAAGKLMPQDFLQKNVVLSPFSKRVVESHLFSAQGSDVLFGTQITSLFGFLRQIMGEKTISNFQKTLFVRSALKSLQGQLKVLGGKITKGLVQGICDEISRFQESCISPQMLLEETLQDMLLAEKVADLAKIYERYLSLIGENLDDFALAQKFLTHNHNFENHNIFFVGYYEISPLQRQVLQHFCACGAKVFVGHCQSQSKNNGYIYNNNLLANLRQNLDVTVLPAPSMQDQNQRTVKNLAFSVNDEKSSLDFMQIFEANDVQVEVQNAARMIKSLLQSGKAKSGEISVLCGELSAYAPVIENQFSAFGLNFCINQSKSLLQMPVARFVQSAVMWCFFQKPEALLNVLLSDFSGLSVNDKMLVQQHFAFFGDEGTKCFASTVAQKPIEDVLQKFSGISENENCILEIINAFALEQKILAQPQFLAQQKSALEQIMQICQQVSGFDFSKAEFFDVFTDALSNASVSMPPAGVDVVWVDDFSRQISPAKFLFVLGANQGVIPAVKADTMILPDVNLDALSWDICGKVLSQNRCARFDAASNLLNFENGLFISYSLVDISGQKLLPSGFVKTFAQSAEKDILTILSKTNFSALQDMNEVEKAHFFARFVGTRENAHQTYLKFLQDPNPLFDCLMPSLGKMFEEKSELVNQFDVDTEKLFFPDSKTKISQIEAYYSCPFKHFMAYGLKLTEPKTAALQSFDVGNLLHKVAEVFLRPQNNFCLQDKADIPQIVGQIFDVIKNDEGFAKLFLEKNKYSLQILRVEAIRLCRYIFETYHKSNFHPKFLEVYFGAKQTFNLRVLNKDFSLVGIVDRVDTYQNNAVVIDYKTGGGVKGNDTELFYGEKLQIFVYAKAISQLQNLNVQGVFYFPVLNKFSEEDAAPYMLRGKNVLAQEFLLNMDNTLSFENPKSTILPCEIKTSKDALKNPEVQFKNRSNHTDKASFDDMIDYAIAMTKQGIKEILEGNFALSPNENACGFCPYLAICQRAENIPLREKIYDIKPGHFALWKGGEV